MTICPLTLQHHRHHVHHRPPLPQQATFIGNAKATCSVTGACVVLALFFNLRKQQPPLLSPATRAGGCCVDLSWPFVLLLYSTTATTTGHHPLRMRSSVAMPQSPAVHSEPVRSVLPSFLIVGNTTLLFSPVTRGGGSQLGQGRVALTCRDHLSSHPATPPSSSSAITHSGCDLHWQCQIRLQCTRLLLGTLPSFLIWDNNAIPSCLLLSRARCQLGQGCVDF